MGYAVYEQGTRWAGYGVPAECDYPDCTKQINRGLAYKCETWISYDYYLDGEPVSHGEDWDEEREVEHEGCQLFYCQMHYDHEDDHHDDHGRDLVAKPDSPEWIDHMLTDESWAQWRTENPERTAAMREHHTPRRQTSCT